MTEQAQSFTITLDNGENIEIKAEDRQPCEVWSRVMGYHRPVSEYNAGKQQEHRERLMFKESLAHVASADSAERRHV